MTVVELPAYLTAIKLTGEDRVECSLCGAALALKDMHNHMGKHILLLMHGADENVDLRPGVKIQNFLVV